jgi:formyl-CoA transferase
MDFAHDDPRWEKFRGDGGGGIGRYSHEVHDIWDRGFAPWTFAELEEVLERYGGWIFPYLDLGGFVDDRQVQFLEVFVDVADQVGATGRQVRPPWQFTATPATVRRPAPLLGEHTAEVIAG